MISRFQTISPIDNSILVEREYALSDEIESALNISSIAQKKWAKTTIQDRAKICKKAVEYFVENSAQFGEEITRQMGRPIRYSPGEITGGFAERANYMIDIAEQNLQDIRIQDDDQFLKLIKHEPMGVVFVMAPWNYPYLTSVNAIIPAIMSGNSVILKHSTQTPLCAERYDEAFQNAELPDGVFQYLHLSHKSSQNVIRDTRVQYIAFTGSVEGGQNVLKSLGSRFIPTGMELGGKDPAYVCSDADIEFSAENLVDGSFFNSGQSCCGIERIYVDHSVYERFVDLFVKNTEQYVLGNPLDPSTTLGPVVKKSSGDYIRSIIKDAETQGAVKLIDKSMFSNAQEQYLAPQVLVNVNHSMALMKEETFGPVVGIMKVKDEEEAIRLMNDSKYGLTASIWSSDIEKAYSIANQVQTGTCFMNRCDYLDPALAWTGIKDSGMGCTLSQLGYSGFTRPKSIHFRK